MLLIFGFILIFILGFLLSKILVVKMHSVECFGVSFLVGLGVFTLIVFSYSSFLNIKITLQSVLVALVSGIVPLALLFKLLKRRVSFNLLRFWMNLKKIPSLEKLVALFLIGIFTISWLIATYFPVYIWDALAIYDFRGKIIASQGFYAQIAKNFFWFEGYPLFTSLSHALVYLFGGKNPQFIYPLIYFSFIFAFYGNLRKFVARKTALISITLLASVPLLFQHSTFAYTNLPYSTFLSLGSIYLFTWFAKKKSLGYLILAAILTGLSTWTRSTEPFWMVNILCLAVLVIYRFKKYWLSFIVYIVSFSVIREPWQLVNYYVLNGNGGSGLQVTKEASSYVGTIVHTVIDPSRILEVSSFIYQNVITSWYPLLFLFLFCVVVNLKGFFKNTSTLFLLIIFLYFGLLLYATYAYSFSVSYWYTIPDSARRMAMFFMPMMVYYIGLALDRFVYEKRK